MLKPQDIVLLLKLLSNQEHTSWSQNQLATHLCMSPSEINASIKRLCRSGLIRQVPQQDTSKQNYVPVKQACLEFLISGLKYVYPSQLGEYTRGIATSYAAPIFEKKIMVGNDPIPVWPYAEGDRRGLALEPLYPSVPKSIVKYPDQEFYNLLTLVDALRQGRARERNIAMQLLREKLDNAESK